MIILPDQFNAVRRVHPDAAIGYTSGVFDLFHTGHANYIEACKCRCDILVVGVDSDRLARSRKGFPRPIQGIGERVGNVGRHAHYVFTKDAPSEYYTGVLRPGFYFYSKDNVVSSEKRRKLSEDPYFRDAIFIPYTRNISTTELLNSGLQGID